MRTSIHRDHHYVPRVYLKHWGKSPGRIWLYRTLVPDSKVPLWKERSVRGIAYHSHLYTRIIAGQESDEFERWLDREIESPAEEVMQKVVAGARLTPPDWKRLVRFLAAQDVRTPSRLFESFPRWDATLPNLLHDVVQESIRELEWARKTGEPLPEPAGSSGDYLPFRVTTEGRRDQKFGTVKAGILTGRSLWLFEIRHAITQTAEILHQHKWTILAPPKDLMWFTSDAPVVRLNFYGPGNYDFKGGWGSRGTDIFLPLSPHHLLYTQVGERRPRIRGEICARNLAEGFRRFIAERADQMIFAAAPDADIPKLRPRLVNASLHRDEKERWRRWHQEQSAAEREMMSEIQSEEK